MQSRMAVQKDELVVGDNVCVLGGKYAGRQGKVWKLTQMMVVIKLKDSDDEVRIWQCNVKKQSRQEARCIAGSVVMSARDDVASGPTLLQFQ